MRFGKKYKFLFGTKKAQMRTISFVTKRKIKDVQPIRNATNIGIKNKEDLKNIVEEPCLKACQDLFEKNIETVDSGCNNENSSNLAYIIIKYDSMNAKNKEIADSLINNRDIQLFKKNIPDGMYFNLLKISTLTTPRRNRRIC